MVNKSKHVNELLLEVELKRLTVEEVKTLMVTLQSLWDEVDQRNVLMDLSPDYDLYKNLEDKDVWFFYTATYEGSTSFYSFFIQPSLHVRGTKQLVSDFIYVVPDHRGTGIADILLSASEDKAKQEGVNTIVVNLKDFQKHENLVSRMGYKLYENSFQKVI